MADVLCVTPNPAVDRTLVVPGFAAGGVWRAAATTAAAGGKGINVARALAGLGRRVQAAGLLAGATGAWVEAAVARECIPATWTRVPGETRTCLAVLDGGAVATVVNEPGPAVAADDWSRFVADVGRLAADARLVAISGSLPPVAEPAQAITRLIAAAAAAGAAVWVDTSGGPLAAVIALAATVPVAGVKVNAAELAGAVGGPIADAAAAAAAGRALQAAGVGRVAVTLGAAGAVLVTGAGAWRAVPPPVPVASVVGAGDAFMAGLLAAIADAAAPDEALAAATAAATASVTSRLAGALHQSDLAAIRPRVAVGRLPAA